MIHYFKQKCKTPSYSTFSNVKDLLIFFAKYVSKLNILGFRLRPKAIKWDPTWN